MDLTTIALGVGAITFAIFGLWLLVRPRAMVAVDIPADTGNARAEIRAMYGGLELGIAAFLALALWRPELSEAALWFQLLALGGLVLGRLVGIGLEKGGVKGLLWLFAAMEAAGVLLTLAAVAQL